MKVLDAFLDVPGEAGTNELARRTGINASTVSRLLSTLVAGGYVEHVPESGRYRLGPHLIRLANHMMSSLDLRTLARPHLTALEQATGETATLSIAGEREAVTVDFVASRKAVATPDGRLERFTDRTLPDAKMLRREIADVQQQGWAQAVKEREVDLNAIAAPVYGANGRLAAILGVQGPAQRFGRKKREAALPLLLERADALSAALGYNPRAH
jgi:IclR family acetate operon transcriptional repressor